MVSLSSLSLILSLIETRGFLKSCSLNNPRADAVVHPITVASAQHRTWGGRWGPASLGLVWLKLESYYGESPAFYAAASLLVWLHHCAFFVSLKSFFEEFRTLSHWLKKKSQCHVSNEHDRCSEDPPRHQPGNEHAGLHGHHARLHYGAPQAPPGSPTSVFVVSKRVGIVFWMSDLLVTFEDWQWEQKLIIHLSKSKDAVVCQATLLLAPRPRIPQGLWTSWRL